MSLPYSRRISEHPMDVMHRAGMWIMDDRVAALAVIMSTEGGAVRAPGAMMAVREDGEVFGYLSGGCIDADVALQAKAAISDNEARRVRYGADSPFMDIRLPCGGAIDLLIVPISDDGALNKAANALYNRKSVSLRVNEGGVEMLDAPETGDDIFTYVPKLRLRIAGRGEDPVALVGVAAAAGIEAWVASPEIETMHICAKAGAGSINVLTTPEELHPSGDDAQTAFVLLFHDADWEAPLLEQALAGPAFYIGAVGSAKTHTKRCEMLRARGVSEADIARVRGPVGLVPSMRDASMLAVSTLAEIVGEFHEGTQT